jgi:uncharacterized protein CbrC (UPF0167 family)
MTKGTDSRGKNSSQNVPTFTQFCRRMWLDHCDENSAFGAVKVTEKEYIKTYNEWLLQKYAEELEKNNESTK